MVWGENTLIERTATAPQGLVPISGSSPQVIVCTWFQCVYSSLCLLAPLLCPLNCPKVCAAFWTNLQIDLPFQPLHRTISYRCRVNPAHPSDQYCSRLSPLMPGGAWKPAERASRWLPSPWLSCVNRQLVHTRSLQTSKISNDTLIPPNSEPRMNNESENLKTRGLLKKHHTL